MSPGHHHDNLRLECTSFVTQPGNTHVLSTHHKGADVLQAEGNLLRLQLLSR